MKLIVCKEFYEKEIPVKVKGHDREEFMSNLTLKIVW